MYGEGHYTTFDDKKFSFNGECGYIFAQVYTVVCFLFFSFFGGGGGLGGGGGGGGVLICDGRETDTFIL